MAERIVEVVLTVAIPVDEYQVTMSDLLDEVESAAQRAGVTYQAPYVRMAKLPDDIPC